MQFVKSFLKDENGPTAVEYAVMLGLILVAAIVGIRLLGTRVDEIWVDNQTKLNV